MEISSQEALRYMGIHGQADAQTDTKIKEMIPLLEEAALFRHAEICLPLLHEKANILLLGGLRIQSAALFEHTRGCGEAVVFAATLGPEVDRLMQRMSKTDISGAVVLQACAATLLESYCDAAQHQLAARYRARGLYLRPRFSPGYEDFSLSHQQAFLQLLEAPKRIGVCCTQTNMLVPTKSITAVIGLTQNSAGAGAEGCSGAGRCSACKKADCAFRGGEHGIS